MQGDQRRFKVLLVEDNDLDARLIRELLKDAGPPSFQLEHVQRTSAALERVSRTRFDVVLLDLTLPDSHDL